jgi:putative tricarboxylic transport membrane protein
MRLGRDGIAGLVCLAISLALLPHAFGLPRLPIVPIGPGFYPAIVLTFMALTSAVLVLQDLLARRRQPPPPEAASPEPNVPAPAPTRAYGLVAGSFVTIAVYIGVLPLLGFRISTVLFVFVFQMLLERPGSPLTLLRQAAVAFGAAAVTYLVFNEYLAVLLPRGSWTGW